MGGRRGDLCADHDLLQGDSIPLALGFCGKQARVAMQEHRRKKLGLLSSVGQGESPGSMLGLFGGTVFALLSRCDAPPSHLEIRRRCSAATNGTVSSLHKSRSARIVVCRDCAIQDLSDRATQGSSLAVVGWPGFWRRSLPHWLSGPWYFA